MSNNLYEYDPASVAVHPPDSLVKFESPLFVGVESIQHGQHSKLNITENSTKLDEMINSMLPAR